MLGIIPSEPFLIFHLRLIFTTQYHDNILYQVHHSQHHLRGRIEGFLDGVVLLGLVRIVHQSSTSTNSYLLAPFP